MKRVVIESPYKAATEEGVERNLRYLRAAMRDCLLRGESPYCSHGLYTQPGVLDDNVPEERDLGINAGFAWRHAAALTVVYIDLGMSKGMNYGVRDAILRGCQVEYRLLGSPWSNYSESEATQYIAALDESIREVSPA